MSQLVFSSKKHIPLVAVGGLFKLRSAILDPLKSQLKHQYPQLRLIRPQKTPAHGALYVAEQYHAGKTALPLSTIII
jgi:hypothetical protein